MAQYIQQLLLASPVPVKLVEQIKIRRINVLSNNMAAKEQLKAYLYKGLTGINFLLQRLIHPNKTRICYASTPDFSDNSYFIFRHILQTRKNYEHVWLIADQSKTHHIETLFQKLSTTHPNGHKIKIINRHSLEGYWCFLTSFLVFHTHGLYGFSTNSHNRTSVCLWHGMPIKCIGYLNTTSVKPIPTFGSFHVATSNFFRYVQAAAFNVRAEQVHITGLPRCDAFLHPGARQHSTQDIRTKLAVKPQQKLVIWMPTYRTERGETITESNILKSFIDDTPSELLVALSQHADKHECKIVIKLHPYDRLTSLPNPDSYKHLQLLTHTQWEAHETQLYDLLAASDALLSDVSSVLIDYLVSNKPMGVLGFNENTYTRDTTFPPENLFLSDAYTRLQNEADIERFLKHVKQNTPTPRKPRDWANNLYSQSSESSSELVLRALGL